MSKRCKVTPRVKGALQPKTLSIEWKIERFFADCEKVGDSYESNQFSVPYGNRTTNWCLEIFPKGEDENNKDFVSLYLCFHSDDVSEVTVDQRISIVTGKNNLSVESPGKETITFEGPSESYGWTDFVEHSFLNDVKNDVLNNDTLTILCEITFHPLAEKVVERFVGYSKWIDKIKYGLKDYKMLLKDKRFSDVTFNVRGKKMHLHKAVLSCRNSVFKAMFEHEMKEKNESSVDIVDCDYDVMKELFRFIYSGQVSNNIENIAEDLLIAADKYDVTQLKALCEKTLYDNLTVGNAVECLKLTEHCDTLHLKTLVIKFVIDNIKEIVQKSDFETVFADLDRAVVLKIMKAVAEKD